MISLQQIRAARGLLNWGQSDMARACGLSLTAVNNIDRGHARPRAQTLQKIRKVFEGQGVEFIDGHGVRLRHEGFRVEVFEEKDAFALYMQDVVETLKACGGEGLHMLDEIFYVRKFRPVFFRYYQQFQKSGLRERLLVKEGSLMRYGPSSCSLYRWCPPELADQIGYSVYGNKYSIFLPEKLIVIENVALADGYRRQFERNWKHARPMPPQKSLFEEDLEKMKS
jgi:transcriptional regulator with XRE-family HTH domain